MSRSYLNHLVFVKCQYSDSLQTGRPGDRIPVWVRSSVPVQTGIWTPFSVIYNGYRIPVPGVKRPGRGVNNPPSSSAEVKERVELYVYFISGLSWPVLGRTFHFRQSKKYCKIQRRFELDIGHGKTKNAVECTSTAHFVLPGPVSSIPRHRANKGYRSA